MVLLYDPAAHRPAVERQIQLLLPVVDHLRESAPAKGMVDPDWRGPAAEAAAVLLSDLRRELALLADLADDTVRTLRGHLAAGG